jgi:hypothetical protein
MGDLSVEVPGLKPKNLGKVLMESTTPQAAVQAGRGFLEHCFGVNPEGVPKQVCLRIVAGAACEPDGDEGGLSVKWADVKVVRADESVEFLLDRSNPGAGHLIRLDGCYCGARPGQYAVLGGVIGEPRDEELATFSASAFCDGEIVSCSGGPAPYVTLADLEATGQTAPAQFWRWRDGISGADRAEHFVVDVPVWSWKGTDDSVFDLDRETVRRALDKMEIQYPDNGMRSDCVDDGFRNRIRMVLGEVLEDLIRDEAHASARLAQDGIDRHGAEFHEVVASTLAGSRTDVLQMGSRMNPRTSCRPLADAAVRSPKVRPYSRMCLGVYAMPFLLLSLCFVEDRQLVVDPFRSLHRGEIDPKFPPAERTKTDGPRLPIEELVHPFAIAVGSESLSTFTAAAGHEGTQEGVWNSLVVVGMNDWRSDNLPDGFIAANLPFLGWNTKKLGNFALDNEREVRSIYPG